jgi:hypothetical protein
VIAVLIAVALATPAHHKKSSSDIDIDIEIPPIEIPRIEIPDVGEVVAAAMRGHDRDDDDDDDDDDNDCDDCNRRPPPPPPTPDKPESRDGMHIYKMTTPDYGQSVREAFKHRSRHDFDSDDDGDTGDATARSNGNGAASLGVKGPVTFRLSLQGGDIDVVSTDKKQVSVRVDGNSDVSLYAFGDRVEPRFKNNRHSFRNGKMHVELPVGSRLEVASMSGDVTAKGIAEAHLRTLSGDIHVSQVGKADIQSISGDVTVDDASGPVRLHTVSGKATLTMSRNATPQVEFQSASGSLDFKGACGRDCRLAAETVSGDLRLALAPSSSFALNYSSHSGELRDGLDLQVRRSGSGGSMMRHSRNTLSGTFGKGEGTIDADAFSGNLVLVKQ